jgi:DNA (cytosine-5)-methyltransferase 1
MGSLFDGIGGFPLAATHAGIEPVWASEIEPFPIEVTRLHFPNMLHVGDITSLNGALLPPVDIICGGSPCQDLSVAGARAGLSGERSGLFMEQIRIVKEMRNADKSRGRAGIAVRPRYCVWENVPGAFSSAEGKDFLAVLREFVQIEEPQMDVVRPPAGRWEYAGAVLGVRSCVAWVTWDAQYFGVPQRRKRIFLVTDFAGYSPIQILFDQDRLLGNTAESEGTWEATAENAGNSPDTAGRDK